ncbi:protein DETOXIFICATION 53 [Macadamia integrifolia]|uniref:protein DETOXIFICATION 53 n=1 Tax=Macadamia integrifolia TaxID=60698 RepID=UPI001C4E302C|nr:protein DETOXIFICATION 53 [Macadamia integrifolia]XP_042514757.1 protein DETOXIFICATION 53 [Macadamia integrifolia]
MWLLVLVVLSNIMCPNKESQVVLCGDRLLVSTDDGERNEVAETKDEEEQDDNEIRNEGEEEEDDDDDNIKGFLPCLTMNEVKEELKSLAKIACPILLTSLLLYSKSIISTLFLGHLGDIELAGGALAMGFANITGYSVIKGLAIGMEPICCQAYGAHRWSVLSQTYQKTVCLLMLVSIPISFMWLNMEHIMLWVGQDKSVTSVAQVILVFSLPDLFAQANLHPLRIFLRTQALTTPLTLAAIFASVLHFPINYLLVIYLNLGVKGVALASASHSYNLILGLLVYSVASGKAIKPWSEASMTSWFMGWRPLLALAVPSALSVCLEWWWYELMQLLCGILVNPRACIAAMGILIQTTGLIYAFPHSLSTALTTRVGHELGANRPARAQSAAVIGLSVAVACGLSAVAFTTAVKNVWGKMFTGDEQILALTSLSLPIVGFCELGNAPQTAACGVFTGSARPKVGANINFGSFYLIGLPVAVFVSFKMGFLGLWIGLVAAEASCLGMMLYLLLKTDWKLQAKRAQELTRVAEGYDLEASLLQ